MGQGHLQYHLGSLTARNKQSLVGFLLFSSLASNYCTCPPITILMQPNLCIAISSGNAAPDLLIPSRPHARFV